MEEKRFENNSKASELGITEIEIGCAPKKGESICARAAT